jgi:hypothetical protein
MSARALVIVRRRDGRCALLAAVLGAILLSDVAAGELPKIPVDGKNFPCISQLTPVRGFFVGNLRGDLESTLEVARAPTGGVYPPGSIVQLIPTEVMVKQVPGTSPRTRDWEFLELEVSKSGSRIVKRGDAELVGSDGGSCLGCHSLARPEWDMICETDHGCAAIPETPALIGALQRTDPRCKGRGRVSAEDAAALRALEELEKKSAMAGARR